MRGTPPRPPLGRRLRARVRSLLRGLLRRSDLEAEMREEFRTHIALRTDDLVGQGMEPEAAARRAHREFGHVETHRAEARASLGLRWVDQIRFSWIDVRLGLRMMGKHPGLTLVAVLALALGIPTGLAPWHLAEALDRPLPEDPEDRIRAIRFWDPATGIVGRPSEGDLTLLTDGLTSFERLGAYRNGGYNGYAVGPDGGRAAPVNGVEVTASTLAMLGVVPELGRLLDRADETPGAPDVVLLGHRVWQARFGGASDIVGQVVRVGETPHTVVGVMPEGFVFPLDHQVWLPLRRSASAMPGEGRPVRIIGRLGATVTDREAQAEIASLVLPPAHPSRSGGTPSVLEVVPFTYSYIGLPRQGFQALPEFHFARLLGIVLLLVACANVAMLVFARTATRFRELAVRTALGAGRWRIISQVFVETLVLAVVASALGLAVVDQVMTRAPWQLIAGEVALPYWLDLGVPAGVLPWAALLTVLSATVAGVVPALRVTRGDIHRSIRQADAGRSGIRFGGGTSALIVADVAIAVGVIGFAVGVTRHLNELASTQATVGIPADEYLAVQLRLSENELAGEDASGSLRRMERLQEELVERLGREPEVRGVVFADALPRMNHRSLVVEADGAVTRGAEDGIWVRMARVHPDFFASLDQPILAGRDFDRADTESPASPVIVNTRFVQDVLGGEEPVGRRIRVVTGDEGASPWHEIVGVVGHLGMNTVSRTGARGVYFVEPLGGIHPVQVGIRVGEPVERFVPRLREIVAEADPTAILGAPVRLGSVQQGDWYVSLAVTGGMALLVAILVVLAASGIYAIMSFSVSQRTREIGIRSALGASRRTLVFAIVRRAAIQLGVGALLGIPLATWGLLQLGGPNADATLVLRSAVSAIAISLAVVALIGLSSCVAPARRALGIEANEALQAEV